MGCGRAAAWRCARPVRRLLAGSSPAVPSVMRTALALAVVGAVALLAVTHRASLAAGRDILAHADAEWLGVAALGTALMWVAGTVTQLGVVPVNPPFRRLFAVQVAASFANQVLPAGSGGVAVNVRFFRRHGMTRGSALAASGLNTVVGMITHTATLGAALLAAPAVLRQFGARVSASGTAAWVGHLHGAAVAGAALAAVLALLAAAARRRIAGTGALVAWGRRAAGRVVREARTLGVVLRDPARAAKLWLGSLSIPLLHAVTLMAVLRALGSPVPVTTVAVIYLLASSVSAVVPSPGGFGALDVTLAAALVAGGVDGPTALGAVLGYRLITVWLPLIPGAFMLAFLVRRRVI
jgi:uncharacterized membrane protein YbhN (UPF0104 family)